MAIITKKRAERCVAHHYACDCITYKMQQMESALKVLRTWAKIDEERGKWIVAALIPGHVVKLCDSALSCLDQKP